MSLRANPRQTYQELLRSVRYVVARSGVSHTSHMCGLLPVTQNDPSFEVQSEAAAVELA